MASTQSAAASHRRFVVPLLSAAVVAVFVIESTPIAGWIHETGLIHLFAITFALAALGILISPRLGADDDFRAFARFAAAAMAALGIAHVMEYFGDTRKLFGERAIITVVSSSYLAAFMLITLGATLLQRKTGAPIGRVRVGIAAFVAAQIAAASLLLYGGAKGEEAMLNAYGAILFLGAAFCITRLQGLSTRLPVLRGFVRCVQASVALVLVSYAFEFFFEQLEGFGLSETRIENVLHYFFYAGLTIFLLGFDRLRHFGGVYEDMRREMASVDGRRP